MAQPDVHIRRANKTDIEVIASIERESFPDPWDIGAFIDTLFYYPATFFVAEKAGRIAGFITAGIENTGEELYGHIMNLAVSPFFRNNGIGSMLVARAEHEFLLEGASGIQLEVRTSNLLAQRFYNNLGYQQVFLIANYYSDDEDAIVMMKWFSV
jgi:ribosomal-protein-alanine N-acetyltransferase